MISVNMEASVDSILQSTVTDKPSEISFTKEESTTGNRIVHTDDSSVDTTKKKDDTTTQNNRKLHID